jgi:hypothetical protein
MPWMRFPSQKAAVEALAGKGLDQNTVSRLARGAVRTCKGFEVRRCDRNGDFVAPPMLAWAPCLRQSAPSAAASSRLSERTDDTGHVPRQRKPIARLDEGSSSRFLEPPTAPAAADTAGRAAVFYFINEAPASRAARMEAAADAAERGGDPACAARWRARAATQRAVAARLPHGGEPNIEWQAPLHASGSGGATADENGAVGVLSLVYARGGWRRPGFTRAGNAGYTRRLVARVTRVLEPGDELLAEYPSASEYILDLRRRRSIWACCSACATWRRLALGAPAPAEDEPWTCAQARHGCTCSTPADELSSDESTDDDQGAKAVDPPAAAAAAEGGTCLAPPAKSANSKRVETAMSEQAVAAVCDEAAPGQRAAMKRTRPTCAESDPRRQVRPRPALT